MESKFHYSFPISDIAKTISFYTEVLECQLGRKSTEWVDINFFGHQLTAVVRPKLVVPSKFFKGNKSPAPVRHFGAVLSLRDWHRMKDQLIEKKIQFALEPKLMFEGQIGEQYSMFIKDPDGYGIEFKAFENDENLFASR